MRMTVREICNSVCRSSTNSAGKKNHRRHTKEHDHSSFYKFLQMEQNHKNTDCYFFYYSKCSKGDNCAFRHEPSALGCETVCSYWQQGNCFNEHCNFRHMELKKNRKSIPCYWEGQPSGCMKPHCPFLHINARSGQGTPNNQVKTPENVSNKPANQDWSNRQDESKFDASSTESDQGRGSSEAGSFIGSPVVDPLIVNFEEESDSEGASSPVKGKSRVPYCKTYEEIRLEEIQAESAAYYSYRADDYLGDAGGGKIRKVSTVRDRKTLYLFPNDSKKSSNPDDLNFKILSLEEIRRKKKQASTLENLKSKTEELSTDKFLKYAMNTLEELKAITKAKVISKRKFSDIEKPDDDRVVKLQKVVDMKVPPVRLRRAYKITKMKDESIDQESEAEQRVVSGSEDESSLGRREEVEIRVCDSSTADDDRIKESEEKILLETETRDCDKLDDVCDSILGVGEEDILKDIDALLTLDV